jgi:nucleoside-diphosphate-sugar epimerase
MLVLVTGAAGYIGAPTVARLIAAGHTVRALDSLRFGGAALLGAYPTGRFTLVRGDIRDTATVAQALNGVDAVVHLASIVGDPACAAEPDLARQVNLDATVVLHTAARGAGVTRFVFASSCSVYGHGDQVCDETAPLRPLSLYAETKAEAERHILGPTAGSTMASTALRFATLYGLAPRMRFDLVVNTFVAHALGRRRLTVHAPGAWRPLVHVADIAAATAAVVDAHDDQVGGEVFNVGSAADNHQLADVAELVAEICGPGVHVDITPVAGDARNYRITGDKLTAATGWAPARTLASGITEMAEALAAGVIAEELRRASA